MPAVITHYLFGREIYDDLFEAIGYSKDECESFLVGCQGPDILFFANMDPTIRRAWDLGSAMHRADPTELLMAFKESVDLLPDDLAPLGRAYLMGLVCHYALDSRMHPFIYSQQYALCGAGVEGLDESDGHEVHAMIESELDILVLSTKENKTISEFGATESMLNMSKRAAKVMSLIYKRVAKELFKRNIPEDAASKSLSNYRLVLSVLYSPSGTKRSLLGFAERLFRKHSFLQAMSHENRLIYVSDFDNHARDPWVDPSSEEISTDGFWDIYERSIQLARKTLESIDDADEDTFEELTSGLDFNGRYARAQIISVE